MKKIALLLSLTTAGSVFCAKTELEILKEKHSQSLEEVVKNLDDMYYETITTNSNGLNYTQGNGLGVNTTSHTTTLLKYNTPEAARAHNVYKKALAPFTNKLFWKDLKISASAGVITALILIYQAQTVRYGKTHEGKIASAGLLIPALLVILGNLSEEEMKYLNDRTLTVHDNLYKNLSWYTTQRILSNILVSGVSGFATLLTAALVTQP